MIDLYPHQIEFLNSVRAAFASHQSVCGQAATGFGKTCVGAAVVKFANDRGNRVLFTTHRDNLIRQTAMTFSEFKVDFGLIAAGMSFNRREPTHIASIQTLVRRLDRVPIPHLLIIDEAHLAAAKTWSKVVDFYREHGTKVLGLTASHYTHLPEP